MKKVIMFLMAMGAFDGVMVHTIQNETTKPAVAKRGNAVVPAQKRNLQ